MDSLCGGLSHVHQPADAHARLAKMFVNNGVDLTDMLLEACNAGDSDVVALLLDLNADANSFNNDEGGRVLDAACDDGFLQIARMLIEHGADINHGDDEGETALTSASGQGHCAIVRLLLDRGATTDCSDHNQPVFALHKACANGHCEVAALLCERGATMDQKDFIQCTPLLCAAFGEHYAVMELLLQYPSALASIDTSDDDGMTALHVACQGRSDHLVALLLKHGAATSVAEQNDGNTPLHVACKQASPRSVRSLLAHGADAAARNNGGETPIQLACKRGGLDCVRPLLDHAVDPNAADNCGRTALHEACCSTYLRYDRAPMVSLLLEAGADTERREQIRGLTPLHLAAFTNCFATTRLLLQHGARLRRNADGQTPIDMARPGGYVDRACRAARAGTRWRGAGVWVRLIGRLQREAAARVYAPGGLGFEDCKRRRLAGGMQP